MYFRAWVNREKTAAVAKNTIKRKRSSTYTFILKNNIHFVIMKHMADIFILLLVEENICEGYAATRVEKQLSFWWLIILLLGFGIKSFPFLFWSLNVHFKVLIKFQSRILQINILVFNISIGRMNIFFTDHRSIEKYIYILFVTSNRIFRRMWIETETTKFLFILYMNVEYGEWWSSYLLPFCPWPSNACLLLSYERKI